MTTIDPSDTKLAYRKLKSAATSWGERILNMLQDNEFTVSDIIVNYSEIHKPVCQADISKWLGLLKNSGVLKDRREGKWIYYKLNAKEIERINSITAQLARMYNPNPVNPLKQKDNFDK